MRKIFIFCSLSLLVLFSLRNHAFGLQSDTGKVYKIQIASFENKISVDEIKRNYYLTETVSVELIGNRYKYFIGDFPVKYDALSYLSTLGIPGAYVVSWEINPNLQAENMKLIARLETIYGLQIAATIKKLQLSIFKSSPYFLDTEVNVYFDGKLFIYTIGEFSDSAKAEKYKLNFSFPSYVVKQTETIIYNSGEGLVKERTEEIIDQEGIDTLREENNIPGKIIDSNDIDSSGIISGEEIIEIEGQAQQNGLIVWFKNLPFYLYALIVFSTILLIVFVIILIIRKNSVRKTAGQNHFQSDREDEISSPFLEKKNEERTMAGVNDIMQLYTNLSTEIRNKENVYAVIEEIENCLNSSNNVLRMEAQLALIRLNPENPFYFLNKLENEFTAWEQLHVYEMLKSENIKVPQFSKWFDSPNETIITFSIKMIRAYNQEDAFEQLIPLLIHKNKEIRKETILTINELRNDQIIPLLKEMYNIEDQDIQSLVQGVIGKIPKVGGDDSKELFHSNNLLKMKAVEALANIEEFGTGGLEEILKQSEEDLQSIARNILDEKI